MESYKQKLFLLFSAITLGIFFPTDLIKAQPLINPRFNEINQYSNNSFITEAVERMIEAANRDELMSFSSINHEFHSIIIKNAGNEILLKTWQTLHIQIKTFLIVDRQEKNLLEMANSHYQIIEAFKVFDAPRAKNEVINHIHHNRPVI